MDLPAFFRGRRLRRSEALRQMVRETEVRPQDLIMPYFAVEHDDPEFIKPLTTMPGQFQFGLGSLEKRVGQAMDMGLKAVILFGIPKHKDEQGSGAYSPDGIVPRAVRRLKDRYPDLVVVTDVCLCEYTSHGHCGLLRKNDESGEVLNDPTLAVLARAAVSHARAGADVVAPSDMMDGRVLAIRTGLDENGFSHIPIMSYAVKYVSGFYGPFGEAAENAPRFGDRRTYQMDPGNSREAMREAAADALEGADMLMVKPAMPYLDIIRMVRDSFDLPVCAYQVSGEYAMLKAAGQNKWLNEKRVVMESLTGIKRAGADMILSYFTEDALKYLGE